MEEEEVLFECILVSEEELVIDLEEEEDADSEYDPDNVIQSLTEEKTAKREKNFKCKECDKAFGSFYHLSRHARTHAGERPFRCNFCGKGFTQKDNARVHVERHRVIKAEISGSLESKKCSICEKVCRTLPELKKHLSRHPEAWVR